MRVQRRVAWLTDDFLVRKGLPEFLHSGVRHPRPLEVEYVSFFSPLRCPNPA